MEKNNGLGVRKGAWTKEEDQLLRKCVQTYGEGKWHLVPLRAGLNRCRKSCRLRWLNYLRPNLKRGIFNQDEVDLIVRLHKLLGNRWSWIAGRVPGRTANDIKNFWNTHFEKKLTSPAAAAAAGESSRMAAVVKTINESNIIRPRPRTFARVVLENPMLEKNPSDLLLAGPINYHNRINIDENVKNNNGKDPLINNLLSKDDVDDDEEEEQIDECIRWWGNLLEISENGSDPGEAYPFTGPGFGDDRNIHDTNHCAAALDDDLWFNA
ncbi:hypothetical protein ACP275_08G065600 [Erythranthe tilingii]